MKILEEEATFYAPTSLSSCDDLAVIRSLPDFSQSEKKLSLKWREKKHLMKMLKGAFGAENVNLYETDYNCALFAEVFLIIKNQRIKIVVPLVADIGHLMGQNLGLGQFEYTAGLLEKAIRSIQDYKKRLVEYTKNHPEVKISIAMEEV